MEMINGKMKLEDWDFYTRDSLGFFYVTPFEEFCRDMTCPCAYVYMSWNPLPEEAIYCPIRMDPKPIPFSKEKIMGWNMFSKEPRNRLSGIKPSKLTYFLP